MLPKDARVLRTGNGAFVDTEHAPKTNVIAQVRSATQLRDGGMVTLQGNMDGELFKIRYHVAEGLDDSQLEGVAHGIMLDYQNKWETTQGTKFPHNLYSSYSLEDLPSDYLGFVQEAKGISLAEIAEHHLGGISFTMSNPEWALARTINGLPKNYTTNPMDLRGNVSAWPSTLQVAAPIPSNGGTWSALMVEHKP